ncbi:hypothetical protein FZEAL_778 [Fusarium zealandicum]|uniref:Uncharacterized protein n=1 Tax=Fusarium zealandicum TaxID=1053134 RepID=A0A8H4UUF9_9HYPO|nr:hypothetical protein FZEAL_778 [Fusarium zealandicum]
MDLKVQRFNGKDYITFWHGTDSGTFGEGYYLMLNESYEVFKKVVPVDDFIGDLHEFRITEDSTALMATYKRKAVDLSLYGISDGWIFDSIFQEIGLNTDKFIFEWQASDHLPVNETLAPLNGQGKTAKYAFDYFHINSIDKDALGKYIISSRYFCNVAAISGEDGSVLWQLGGWNHSFEDLSDGAATDFTWNHHAAWQGNKALPLRGLMINLGIDAMTATPEQDCIAPKKILSPSQGSVQLLPNGNVLVGWVTSQPLPSSLEKVGRPKTLPDVARRPQKNVLFVSWNGATEVVGWRIQGESDAASSDFHDHGSVCKTTFETKIAIPKSSREFIRVEAVDKHGNTLARSEAVSKNEYTITELLEAPSRGTMMEPFHIFLLSLSGAVKCLLIAIYFRFTLRRGLNKFLRRGASFRYQALPMRS